MPDLYAAFLLPAVLSGFARVYPFVKIELRCSRSIHLFAALQRDEIDVAIMTRQPEFGTGLVIRQEPLVWVAAKDMPLPIASPVPLALMPIGSIFRQHALEALKECNRDSVTVAVSDSIAGLQAAVYARLAVSVFPLCAVTSDLQRLRRAEGLPSLPKLDIILQRRTGRTTGEAADHLAGYIAREFGGASK